MKHMNAINETSVAWMKHYLCNIWNITYATYETSLMQHSKCNLLAHAHEWISDAYAHAMQVLKASLTPRLLQSTPAKGGHWMEGHRRRGAPQPVTRGKLCPSLISTSAGLGSWHLIFSEDFFRSVASSYSISLLMACCSWWASWSFVRPFSKSNPIRTSFGGSLRSRVDGCRAPTAEHLPPWAGW
jgi:hypothetical protein